MGKETVGLLWDRAPAFGNVEGKEGAFDLVQQKINMTPRRTMK